MCFQIALSALKAELHGREKILDEREGALPTTEKLPGAFRVDAEVTKSNENQCHKVVSGSQIGTTHRQVQADVQPSPRTTYENHKAIATTHSPNPPVQEGVNFLSIVKMESVAREDIAGDNVQNMHDSGKSAMKWSCVQGSLVFPQSCRNKVFSYNLKGLYSLCLRLL